MSVTELVLSITSLLLGSGLIGQFLFYRQKQRQEKNRTDASTLENLEKLFSSIYGEMIQDLKTELREVKDEVKLIKIESNEKDKQMRQIVKIATKCNDCKILEIV